MPLSAVAQYDGLVINELLPNPRNGSGIELDANADGVFNVFDDEYIELLNTSTNNIELEGCWLADLNTNIQRHVFSARTLPPGGSMVVFGGGSLLNFSNPPAQAATGSGLSLNNNADETITLYSPTNTVVDQVSFRLTASHDAIALVRDPDGTGSFTNHLEATGGALRCSPGTALQGQPFLTNQPPVLLDMADQTAFVGLELSFPVRAYDPADRDSITLTASNAPAGAVFSSTGGVGTFSFIAETNQATQTFDVDFNAADTNGSETQTISIQVINPNSDEEIWINEIHYDNEGDDSDEGVEIAGTAGSVLTEYTLFLYNGGNGQYYSSNDLTGTLDNEQCGYGAAWFGYPLNGLQNDTEAIALVKGTNVIQFLSYEGTLTASNGPAEGMTSIDIGVQESGTTPVDDSLQLVGTGTVYSSFTWTNARVHSRGDLNDGQEIECLGPPSIQLEKTVYLGHDGGASAPGSESIQGTNGAAITYVFIVSNTGLSTLTNVVVIDVILDMAPMDLGTLLSGESKTGYVESAISSDLRNTASVEGFDPDGVAASDLDTADVLEIIPTVDISKTVYAGHDGGASAPGSDMIYATNGMPVTYCFTVENNGNTNLYDLVVTDSGLGIDPIAIGTLAAGESFSTSVAAFVTASLTNLATVTGTDPNSDPVSDQDTATVVMIRPEIQIQKTVYAGHDGGASGPGVEQISGMYRTPITWYFQIANTGDTSLTNVVLLDPAVYGFAPAPVDNLNPGQTLTYSFDGLLYASLVNSATVTAYVAPLKTTLPAVDTAEVILTNVPDPGYEGEYDVVNLQTLGGNASEAFGINDRGEIVGASLDADGHTQAFHWRNHVMTGLGHLSGGTTSTARAINEAGDIAGEAYVSGTNCHAFLYASNQMVSLGTLGGPNSWGRGINDHREICGSSQLTNNLPNKSDPETFVWISNQFVHIPPFKTDYYSCDGYDINNDSQVCGITFTYSPNPRWWAYMWQDDNQDMTYDFGEMKLLGSMAVKDSSGEYSGATCINTNGEIAGWTGVSSSFYPQHGFLVTPSNSVWKIPNTEVNPLNLLMRDLGALETPANNSYANSINDNGWIVGTCSSTTGVNQAFLWRNGNMVNLNDLIAANSPWVLTNATGINNNNEICGTGLFNGQKRAFLLGQGGRISRIDPVFVFNGVSIYTNELEEVVTQELWRVDSQVIQWAGRWTTNETPVQFTVEYCDPLQEHTWAPFPPTSQWPIAGTVWTNTVFSNRMRYFRIRAE